MRNVGLVLCLVVLASLCATPASATLIGDEVMVNLSGSGVSLIGGNLGSAATVIDPGIEYTAQTYTGVAFNNISIDLNGSQVMIEMKFTGGSVPQISFAHNFTFSGLDWVGHPDAIITGLSLVSSDYAVTPTVSNLSDHGFVITVAFQQYDTSNYPAERPPPYSATFDIHTSHEVPEPTTMALLGMGAAGLIAKRRRIGARADL